MRLYIYLIVISLTFWMDKLNYLEEVVMLTMKTQNKVMAPPLLKHLFPMYPFSSPRKKDALRKGALRKNGLIIFMTIILTKRKILLLCLIFESKIWTNTYFASYHRRISIISVVSNKIKTHFFRETQKKKKSRKWFQCKKWIPWWLIYKNLYKSIQNLQKSIRKYRKFLLYWCCH